MPQNCAFRVQEHRTARQIGGITRSPAAAGAAAVAFKRTMFPRQNARTSAHPPATGARQKSSRKQQAVPEFLGCSMRYRRKLTSSRTLIYLREMRFHGRNERGFRVAKSGLPSVVGGFWRGLSCAREELEIIHNQSTVLRDFREFVANHDCAKTPGNKPPTKDRAMKIDLDPLDVLRAKKLKAKKKFDRRRSWAAAQFKRYVPLAAEKYDAEVRAAEAAVRSPYTGEGTD